MDPTNTQASATSTRSAAGEDRAAVSVTYGIVDCGTTAPTYCGVKFLKKKFNCFEIR
jgi:hypothetical protein